MHTWLGSHAICVHGWPYACSQTICVHGWLLSCSRLYVYMAGHKRAARPYAYLAGHMRAARPYVYMAGQCVRACRCLATHMLLGLQPGYMRACLARHVRTWPGCMPYTCAARPLREASICMHARPYACKPGHTHAVQHAALPCACKPGHAPVCMRQVHKWYTIPTEAAAGSYACSQPVLGSLLGLSLGLGL